MKLSELYTGESGVIVNVKGHGGFRKRIVEMGFIKGELVEVLLNAPLRDPVKYKIMDYEVSLRRAEAEGKPPAAFRTFAGEADHTADEPAGYGPYATVQRPGNPAGGKGGGTERREGRAAAWRP